MRNRLAENRRAVVVLKSVCHFLNQSVTNIVCQYGTLVDERVSATNWFFDYAEGKVDILERQDRFELSGVILILKILLGDYQAAPLLLLPLLEC